MWYLPALANVGPVLEFATYLNVNAVRCSKLEFLRDKQRLRRARAFKS